MIHANCGLAVEGILKASVNLKSLDNLTVVIIAFKHFRKKLKYEIDEFQKALNLQNEVPVLEAMLTDDTQLSSIDEANINETKQFSGNPSGI